MSQKSAKEVLAAAGYPQTVIDAFSEADARKYAKKADPKWIEPPKEPELPVEIKSYTPEKGKHAGKVGMYLSITTNGFSGVFTRLNDGDALNAEGKTQLIKLLTSVASNAAELLQTISQ